MQTTVLEDVKTIVDAAIRAASPTNAVKQALVELPRRSGKLVLVAIGKAAWEMANAAYDALDGKFDDGLVVTKRGHSRGPIGALRVREAGHPVPDAGSYAAAQEAIELVSPLGQDDLVLFLVSGGGSALFEKPTISPEETQDVSRRLLACGANITEINTLRKRLSAVKGGKFAQLCAPANVFAVVLSDVLGDSLDTIASGPAYPDRSTCQDAAKIVQKYDLKLSKQALAQLAIETPKSLDNVETRISGSVRQLCQAAKIAAEKLGYDPVVLTDRLCCEAREAGGFLASIASYHAETTRSLAFIAGGETIVRLTGDGLGGRNQEIALGAAAGISGIANCAVFSVGSDGTDGPTDAAGGVCTGETACALAELGVDIHDVLKRNDSYHALEKVRGLIFTGPTGTNVNDLSCVLIKR